MGAAIPISGGIVVDLAKHMNAVLAVDQMGQTASVPESSSAISSSFPLKA
jgi:FAD/FMN-containing dehydrogenase